MLRVEKIRDNWVLVRHGEKKIDGTYSEVILNTDKIVAIENVSHAKRILIFCEGYTENAGLIYTLHFDSKEEAEAHWGELKKLFKG